MVSLDEYIDDYLSLAAPGEKISNKEIAEAYLDQNLAEGSDFDEEFEKILTQLPYYTGRES